MALRLRRGTNAERATRVFDLAEPVWVTDKNQLWIGTGTGSVDPIQSYAGTGLSYSYNSTNGGRLSVSLSGLTTDSLTQGGTNKYFSNQLAQDAFGELIANGTHTGISFTYNPVTHSLSTTVTDDVGITEIVQDTSPELGGDLTLNGNDIIGTGNIDFTGSLTVKNAAESLISLYGISNSTETGASYIDHNVANGTLLSPTTTVVGGVLSGLRFNGFTNTGYKLVSGIFTNWASSADLSDEYPASNLIFIVGAQTGLETDVRVASLDDRGSFKAPIIETTAYTDQAAISAFVTSPSEGMIVFNQDTQKYQGYVNDTGLAGGGAPNLTPGWVDLN